MDVSAWVNSVTKAANGVLFCKATGTARSSHCTINVWWQDPSDPSRLRLPSMLEKLTQGSHQDLCSDELIRIRMGPTGDLCGPKTALHTLKRHRHTRDSSNGREALLCSGLYQQTGASTKRASRSKQEIPPVSGCGSSVLRVKIASRSQSSATCCAAGLRHCLG